MRLTSFLICAFLSFAFPLQGCTQNIGSVSVNADSLALANAIWRVDSLDGFVLKQLQISDNSYFGSCQNFCMIELPRNSECRLAFAYDSTADRTSSIAQRHGALAAINGSFFDMDDGSPVCYLRIAGREVGINTPAVTDTVNRKFYQYSTIVLRKGRAGVMVTDSNRFWERSVQDSNIMTTGPLLIFRDSLLVQDVSRSFVAKRHNRTALGRRRNGTVILFVADGRHKGFAEGLSLPELQQTMRWLGCRDAINLDGGGSSTMYVKDMPYNGVVNYPSDNQAPDHEGERRVSNIIMITK